ncbi:Hypothetical predicted protein [Lecanosticta acicola]|uniref:Uncharacterized protein n=1 Tax=Lecanosticta acicola TaxID=111012 RepID=A0AAI8Z0A1_9PEZI|nr:Hypothetical predicted protein [Lecanosticta acicola]
MAPKKKATGGGGGGGGGGRKGGKKGGGVEKTAAAAPPKKAAAKGKGKGTGTGTGSGAVAAAAAAAAASSRGNPPGRIDTQAHGIGRRTRGARGHRAGEGEEVSPLEVRDVDKVLREGKEEKGKGKGRGRGRGRKQQSEETEDSQSQRPDDEATEGEQQAQGSEVPATGAEQTSSTPPSGKRLRGNAVDDADETSPKKTKKGKGHAGTGEGPEQGGSQQADAPETAEGACEKLSRLLNERTQSLNAAIERGELADDPLVEGPEEGQRIHSLAVWRAIAAVTEAITEQGNGTEFSLLDGMNFGFMRRGEPMGQNVVRPGNEAFIPRIERHTVPLREGRPGNNADYADHTSLLHLRREEGANFSLQHYDTANRFDHHRRDLQTYGDSIRNGLATAGWNPRDPADIAAAQDAGNQGRQRYNWECSYYAVLFSWALALGLDVSNFHGVDNNYGLFSRRLVPMLGLALQGFLDSDTIEAFLKCYRFIAPDAQIPPERRFARTVPFRAAASLETRTRLEHEIRQAAEALETQIPATLGLLLQALGEPEGNLQDGVGFDYVLRYVDLQRLSEPPPGESQTPNSRATNLQVDPDSATRARTAAMGAGLTREDVRIGQAVAAGLQADHAGRRGSSVGGDGSVDEAGKAAQSGEAGLETATPGPPNTPGTDAAGPLPGSGNTTVDNGPATFGGNTRSESPLTRPRFSEDIIDADLRARARRQPESGAPAGGFRAFLDELPESTLVGPRGLLAQWHGAMWFFRWLLEWRSFLIRVRQEQDDPSASAQNADIATFIRQQAEGERQFLVGEGLLPADRTFNDGGDSMSEIQRAQMLYLHVHVEQQYIREAEEYIRARTAEPSYFEQTLSWIFNGGWHPLGLTEDEEDEVQRLQNLFRQRHNYDGDPQHPGLEARLTRLGTAIRTLFPAQRDVIRAGIPAEQIQEVERVLRVRDNTLDRSPRMFVEYWVHALRGLIRAHANRDLTTDAERAAAQEDEDLYDDSQRGGRRSNGGAGGSGGPGSDPSQGGSSQDLPSGGWSGGAAMQELLNNGDDQGDSSSSVPSGGSDEQQAPGSGSRYQNASNAQDDEDEEEEEEVLGVPQEFLDLVEEVRMDFGEPSGEEPLGERLEALWTDLQEAGVPDDRQLYILTGWIVAQEDRLQDEGSDSNRASLLYAGLQTRAGLTEAEQDRLTWIFEQLYREDAHERLREQIRWLGDFLRAPEDRTLRVDAVIGSGTMEESRARYFEEVFWHLAEQRGRRALENVLPAWFPPVEIAHDARTATRNAGESAVVADGEAARAGLQELFRRLEAAGLPPGVRARLNGFFNAQGPREATRQELWQRQRFVRDLLRFHGDVQDQYRNDQAALESALMEHVRSWQYQYLKSPRQLRGGESPSYMPSSLNEQSGAATHQTEDAQNGVTSPIYPPEQPQTSPDQQHSSSSGGAEPSLRRYDEARLNPDRQRADEWAIQRQDRASHPTGAVPGTEEEAREDVRARANEILQNPEWEDMLHQHDASRPYVPPPPRTGRPADTSPIPDYGATSPLSHHSSDDGSRIAAAGLARPPRGPNAHLDSPVSPPLHEQGYSRAQLEDIAALNRLLGAAQDATPEPEHQPPAQQSGGSDNNPSSAASSSLENRRSSSYEGNQTRDELEQRSSSYDSPTPVHPGRGTSVESSQFHGGSDSSPQVRQSSQSHSPAVEHEPRGESAEPGPGSSSPLDTNASRRGTEASLPDPAASSNLPDAEQAEEPDDRDLFDGDLEEEDDDTSAVEQQNPSPESPTPGLALPPTTGPPTAFFMPVAPPEIVPPLPQFQMFPGAMSPTCRKRSWEQYSADLTGEKSEDDERSKSPRTQTEPLRMAEGHHQEDPSQQQRRSLESEMESSLPPTSVNVHVRPNLIDVSSGQRIGTGDPNERDETTVDSASRSRETSDPTAYQLQSRLAEQRRLSHPHHHHRRPYS